MPLTDFRTGSLDPSWPAKVATKALRKAFLKHLFSPKISPQSRLRLRRADVLLRFYRALINPFGQDLTEQWLRTFATDALPRWEGVLNWEETRRYQAHSYIASEVQLPEDRRKLEAIYRLFKDLLGIAIMRPVIGDLPEETSIFYSEIDHKYLNPSTKQLILESVVVPPGQGSVGRCIKRGSYCVGVSFADYAGVVEWQDLVQGQVSIVMVSGEVKVSTPADRDGKELDQERRASGRLHIVLMLFFPIPQVFNDTFGIGSANDMDDYSLRPAVVFLESLQACLKDPAVSDTVGVLTEYQDQLRRNQQFEDALHKLRDASKTRQAQNTHPEFPAAIVNSIIPKRFTELPVPLDSAVAIVADRSATRADRFLIANLRTTTTALETIVQTAAHRAIPAFLSKLATPGVSSLAGLFSLPQKATGILDFHLPESQRLAFLPAEDESCRVIWWIHTMSGAGWPEPARRAMADLYKPLERILRILEQLNNLRYPIDVQSPWRSPSRLFGEFKLRHNIVEDYFGLVCRLLFADDKTETSRHKELRFLLRISAGFAAFGANLESVYMECDAACEASRTIRAELLSLGNDFIGATASVRIRHGIQTPGDSSTHKAKLRRLLQMIRLKLILSGGKEPIQESVDGEKLTVSPPQGSSDCFLATWTKPDSLVPIDIPLREVDLFTTRTDLHPDRAEYWTQKITKEIGPTADPKLIRDKLFHYLGLRYGDPVSQFSLEGKFQAGLWLALTHDEPSSQARVAYLEKLKPLTELFEIVMAEQYRTAQYRVQADLAMFARGASHGFKNAIVGTEFLLGQKPKIVEGMHQQLSLLLDKQYFLPIEDLTRSAIAVQRDFDYLKDSARTFFWVMDPDRDAEQNDDKELRSLDKVMTGALLKGVQVGIDRVKLEHLRDILPPSRCLIQRAELDQWKQVLMKDIAECRIMYLNSEHKHSDEWRESLRRFIVILTKNTRLRFDWPNAHTSIRVEPRTARILEELLPELIQNATKAAILYGTTPPAQAVAPALSMSTEHFGIREYEIRVSNTAIKESLDRVRRFLDPDVSANRNEKQLHGIKGLWQLQLLCDLSNGAIRLLMPDASDFSLTMTLHIAEAAT